MSLYGGLGLDLDLPKPKQPAVAAPEDKKDDKKNEKDKPKTASNWSSSVKMLAPQLRRKAKASQQQRKTPAEIAAKLNQLRAQQKGADPVKKIVVNKTPVLKTVVSSAKPLGGTTSDKPESFQPPTGPTDFKDEYHPKRPNDYEHWNAIFEKEMRAKRKEKEVEEDDERDRQRRKASKNTAAIAPPSSLVGEIAQPKPKPVKPQTSTLWPSKKPAQPQATDEILMQNPFDSDGDDNAVSDPFANMPVTGFGAQDSSAPGGAGLDTLSNQAATAKPATNLQMSGEDAWAARARLGNKGVSRTVGAETVAEPQLKLVRQAATTVAAPSPAIVNKPKTVEQSKPSRVMLLMNLVGPGEVDSDLQGETAEECSKFGTVVKCRVHECPPNSTPPEEAVRIFVEFASMEGAKKAVKVMHGRSFGGRIVHAQYYDLSKYLRNVLSS